MELSRLERGGNLKFAALGVGALTLAAIAKVGLLVLSKNKRTPQHSGGWTMLDFDTSEHNTTETAD